MLPAARTDERREPLNRTAQYRSCFRNPTENFGVPCYRVIRPNTYSVSVPPFSAASGSSRSAAPRLTDSVTEPPASLRIDDQDRTRRCPNHVFSYRFPEPDAAAPCAQLSRLRSGSILTVSLLAGSRYPDHPSSRLLRSSLCHQLSDAPVAQPCFARQPLSCRRLMPPLVRAALRPHEADGVLPALLR